jgi:hypothetical protein
VVGDLVGRDHSEGNVFAAPPFDLPAAGTTTIAGHTYMVRSFAETGFGGERLTVWVLA